MSTLTRFAFIVVALFGTVSTVSAAPRHSADSYTQSENFNFGAIDNFNQAAHKQD
jgi:hypothetical protein